MNERQFIEAAKQGDVSAFSSLVKLNEERAIHTAYSVLGNWEDARDAAQEGFVKAFGKIRSFKGDSKFSTWLHRILMNHCKDALRKKKIRNHLSVFVRSKSEEDKEPMETLVAEHRTTEKTVMDHELKDQIYAAVDKLPFQQRCVFSLRYLEGMSLSEIADAFELTVGAVKSHLWQATQKVQKNLSPYLMN